MSDEKTYICPTCGCEFQSSYQKIYCSKKCRYTKHENEKSNEEIQRDREKVKRDAGFSNLKTPMDMVRAINEELQKKGLLNENDPNRGLVFTKDFYAFMGFGIPHDYFWPLQSKVQKKVHDMRKRHLTVDASGQVYTPMDDMYGTPGEGDTWYDYGRIPTSHLFALTSQRIGIGHAVCNRPAEDMFDNDYEFVKRDDPNSDPILTDQITTVKRWSDRVYFNEKLAQCVDFGERTGNGYFIVEKYENQKVNPQDWKNKAPNTRPERIQTFDAYHVTPYDVWQPDRLDYDRQDWNFLAGVHSSRQIHSSRIFVFGLRRMPYSLRDLALPEHAWVSFICYLNGAYHLLKGLAQLGTVTVGVQVDKEFPTATEVSAYLTYLKAMKANNFYVLGKGAMLKVENAASKLGGGLNELMEFFKEDICTTTVFPKNQLFGRSEGGGISGAGAIVSKEDYLASNVSVKFSKVKRYIMWILQNMCFFKGLDDVVPKLNIDLHKTESQRLEEALMREQLEQQKIITKQQQLMLPLYRKQLKLQSEMVDIQMKMAKTNPEMLMNVSDKDEENLEEKKKQDFEQEHNHLRYQLLVKEREYKCNNDLLNMLRADTHNLKMIKSQEEFAYKKYIGREKYAKNT